MICYPIIYANKDMVRDDKLCITLAKQVEGFVHYRAHILVVLLVMTSICVYSVEFYTMLTTMVVFPEAWHGIKIVHSCETVTVNYIKIVTSRTFLITHDSL